MGEYTTVLAVAKVKSRRSIDNNRLRAIANNNGCISADKDQFSETTDVVKHILLFDELINANGLILRKKVDEISVGNKVNELLFYFVGVDKMTTDILKWAFGEDNITVDSVDASVVNFKPIVDKFMYEHGYMPDEWTEVQTGPRYVKELLQLFDGFTVFGDRIITEEYINLNAERDVRAWYVETMKHTKKRKKADDAKMIILASNIMLRTITFISEFRKKNRHNMYSYPIEHDPITQTKDSIASMFIAYACMKSKYQVYESHVFDPGTVDHFAIIGRQLMMNTDACKYMTRLEYSIASDPYNIIVLYKDVIHDITKENLMTIIDGLKEDSSFTTDKDGISNYRAIIMSYMTFINWYFTSTYDAFGPIFADIIDEYFNGSVELAMDKINKLEEEILGE